MEKGGELTPALSILHLSGATTWRGGEQQIAYLFEWQLDQGMEPYLLCPAVSALGDRLQAKHPQRIFRAPLRNALSLSFAKEVGRLSRNLGVDLLHLHDAKAHNMGFLAQILGFITLPMVLHRRVVRKPSHSFLTRWKYNHPSIGSIFCVSQEVSRVMHAYVRQPEKIRLVYSAIHAQPWKVPSQAPDSVARHDLPRIGFVGALEKEKGLFDFLSVAKKVSAAFPCQFLLVGGGSLAKTLRQEALSLGLENQIVFTGFVENVGPYLAAMDIFLFPSLEEGLGTSVLDAMAMGIPVVASQVGGIPELLVSGQQGFLAKPGEVNAMVSHCLALLKDPLLRKQMGQEGVKRAQFFSVERMGFAILEAYKALLGL
jgi:L-malate glycosyltransferase